MKVLVAPLNWGLGHATRVIPVIRELLRNQAEVVIASDGDALALLRSEFPSLSFYVLPSWNIRYSAQKNLVMHLLLQSGKVRRAIRDEHRVTREIVEKEGINAVISDSRPGCYSPKVKSVVMTHQLFPVSPVFQGFIRKVNLKMLRKFDEVWVVDVPGPGNLSGKLSYQPETGPDCRHLGILSRFHRGNNTHDSIEILAIISGPEPQRSLFEKELIPKLKQSGKRAVVLLGKPAENAVPVYDGNLIIYPHLGSEAINELMTNADVIVSRSGYTTIMDLAILHKKALLIPTPGQPEQEYLAEYCASMRWFAVQKQGEIDLGGIDLVMSPKGIPERNFISGIIQTL